MGGRVQYASFRIYLLVLTIAYLMLAEMIFKKKNKRKALNSPKRRVKVSEQCYWDAVFFFLTPLLNIDWFTPNLGTMCGSVMEVTRLAYDPFYTYLDGEDWISLLQLLKNKIELPTSGISLTGVSQALFHHLEMDKRKFRTRDPYLKARLIGS